MKKRLRLATRQSALALWQANFVKQQLLLHYPDIEIELLPMTTQGDRKTDVALNAVGGKSLFTKELQQAVLKKKADFAVHSVKDMSAQETPGLVLTAILKREDPRDVLVSEKYSALKAMPKRAVVGTCSPRRVAELKAVLPDVETKLLRGNVPTRLQKLENQEFDAIILAAAGLKRLNLEHKITEYLSIEDFVPAIGQGAMGVECRAEDQELIALFSVLNDSETATCVRAERIVNQILGGDCYTPLGVHAILEKNEIVLRAVLGTDAQLICHVLRGPVMQAETIAREMGKLLLHITPR